MGGGSCRKTGAQVAALDLKHGDDEYEETRNDPRFCAECLQGTVLRNPVHLEVSDAEAAETAREAQQRRDLAL